MTGSVQSSSGFGALWDQKMVKSDFTLNDHFMEILLLGNSNSKKTLSLPVNYFQLPPQLLVYIIILRRNHQAIPFLRGSRTVLFLMVHTSTPTHQSLQFPPGAALSLPLLSCLRPPCHSLFYYPIRPLPDYTEHILTFRLSL